MKDCKGETTMHDIIETAGQGSLIQHGKHNNRVYLMKLDPQDLTNIIEIIEPLAAEHSYAKIFCKIPKQAAPVFYAHGYILEAYIPKFYDGTNDAFMVSKFLDADRLINTESQQLKIFHGVLAETPDTAKKKKKISSSYSIRKVTADDVEKVTQIYREVFDSYPFPIHNSGYILKTMKENVQYFGIEKDGKLVALSSAEVDENGSNAEMTDFATDKNHTGKGLALVLLKAMEKEMEYQGIKTMYTIARLNSIAMNKTFIRHNYTYSGTLINNTNISGKIESMNVYYKHLNLK